MMNKKIIMSLAVVIVAVTAGIFTMDYTNNYDPFSDSKYADNISTATTDNIVPIYDGIKGHTSVDALYPEYTFKELIDTSDNIIIGTIKKVSYVEEPFDTSSNYMIVSTDYTVTVDSNLKGVTPNEVIVTTGGGVTTNHFTAYDEMFVFKQGDQVLLMIGHVNISKDEFKKMGITPPNFEWTPNTPAGMYKIISDGTNSEVHKYGESTSVPLSEFKSIIRSIVG